MKATKTHGRLVEAGLLGGVAAIIAAELAAIQAGLGPFFGVVGLGYLLVLLFVYWMYRRAKVALNVHVERDLGFEVVGHGGPALPRRVLRDVDIFRSLTDEQMDRVASLGKQIHVSEGKVLGEQNEPGYFMFVVLEGKAQLSTRSGLGEVTVRIAGPTESFPLASLLGPGILITSARAMADMKLLAIPRNSLRELCLQDPQIGMRIYAAIAEVLASRYRRTLQHLAASAEMAFRPADFWANL